MVYLMEDTFNFWHIAFNHKIMESALKFITSYNVVIHS